MVHKLLLLVFLQETFIDSQQEGRGEVLVVGVELGEGLLGRKRVPLELGTELQFDIVLGGVWPQGT